MSYCGLIIIFTRKLIKKNLLTYIVNGSKDVGLDQNGKRNNMSEDIPEKDPNKEKKVVFSSVTRYPRIRIPNTVSNIKMAVN
jgi:hypothetical protein